MLKFKAKLRRIGNSMGVIVPKDVITGLQEGDEIELNVITNDSDVITQTSKMQPDVITSTPIVITPPEKPERLKKWAGPLTKERQVSIKGFNK